MEVVWKAGLLAQYSLGKTHEHRIDLPLSILRGAEHQTPSFSDEGAFKLKDGRSTGPFPAIRTECHGSFQVRRLMRPLIMWSGS